MKKEKKLQNKMVMTYLENQSISKVKNNIELECSLKWNAGYSEDIFPYTNNIYQKMEEPTCWDLEVH